MDQTTNQAYDTVQGLSLKRGEAARALSSWGAAAYGVVSILFLTPLLALAVQRLPLGRPELAFGLAVFCWMPTALSSGVTLTQVRGSSIPSEFDSDFGFWGSPCSVACRPRSPAASLSCRLRLG